MLRRKIDEFLLDWKNRDVKKSIFIDGPRQVGKTFAIKQFAKKKYKDINYFYINFLENKELRNIFSREVRIQTLYQNISLYFPEKEMVPGKTLLVFDEIQECSQAILALRHFTTDAKYDVIASGAFVDVSHELEHSFPVGYVERYHLYSIDFEEFLWANNYSLEDISNLELEFSENDERVLTKHNELSSLFREYMAIGGMPEVVDGYLKDRDYKKAFSILSRMIDEYDTDILRYASNTIKYKTKDVFQTLHLHLLKDYKKFQYRLVSEGGRSNRYSASLDWLIGAGIVHKSTNLTAPLRPLQNNVRSDVFKLYFHDHGLLVGMLGIHVMIDILKGNLNAANNAVLENCVACILASNDFTLYYFEKNGKLEVDFIIQYKRELAGVEVKTADRPKSKILPSLLENYGVKYGIRFSQENMGVKEYLETYPLYLSIFVKR
ncbi:ATP-binding protein [Candidatus Izimaplasma bacterium]|nr:ATP-binding protein [Candidatus Izimaplasma bacterium]